jgi:tight adherence protein B
MNALTAATAGMLLTAGIVLAIRALSPTQGPARASRPARSFRRLAGRVPRRVLVLLAVGTVAGVLVAVLSGVGVFVVVVPAAVVGLPALLGKQDRRERDLLSGLEAWARTLAAASGTGRLTLRDVIAVTRTSAPAVLRPGVDRLERRMTTTWTTTDALRAFADEHDSAWVDEVAIYLIQAADFSSSGLAAALNGIADLLAAQVKLRADIFRERERPRRVMIQITAITAGTAALVVLFARTPQLAPYSTPIGQALLLIVLSTLVGLLLWARWIGRPRPDSRVLLTESRRP